LIQQNECVILTHRIRLVPNKEQEQYFIRACGVARFAYNWALVEWERLYALGEPRSELLLRRKLNATKDVQFPWMREVTKNAQQQAIKNLGRAYALYFRSVEKARRGEIPWSRVGKPRFKRKGVRDSFRADNGSSKERPNAVRVAGQRVKLPCIGWIKIRCAP
jgi:putative transposase